MESTGKITGGMRAALSANFDLMAKTVAKAQLLGMNLKSVEQSAMGMLDFEQSITKEMEAELFLGRELNLEKARLYAMTMDYD